MHAWILIFFCILMGCSLKENPRLPPIRVHQFSKIKATCENVDDVIAHLHQQKKYNANRFLRTFQCVPGLWGLFFLIKGEYEQNLDVALGEWDRAFEQKLKELHDIRLRCRENEDTFF